MQTATTAERRRATVSCVDVKKLPYYIAYIGVSTVLILNVLALILKEFHIFKLKFVMSHTLLACVEVLGYASLPILARDLPSQWLLVLVIQLALWNIGRAVLVFYFMATYIGCDKDIVDFAQRYIDTSKAGGGSVNPIAALRSWFLACSARSVFAIIVTSALALGIYVLYRHKRREEVEDAIRV